MTDRHKVAEIGWKFENSLYAIDIEKNHEKVNVPGDNIWYLLQEKGISTKQLINGMELLAE